MTDVALAQALGQARDTERELRASMPMHPGPNRDQALIALRHTAALVQSLEKWIASRALQRTPAPRS